MHRSGTFPFSIWMFVLASLAITIVIGVATLSFPDFRGWSSVANIYAKYFDLYTSSILGLDFIHAFSSNARAFAGPGQGRRKALAEYSLILRTFLLHKPSCTSELRRQYVRTISKQQYESKANLFLSYLVEETKSLFDEFTGDLAQYQSSCLFQL